MRFCPECGNAGMRYAGIGDGFGAYGELFCDVYICEGCGFEEADECMNCDDDTMPNLTPEEINKAYKDYE